MKKWIGLAAVALSATLVFCSCSGGQNKDADQGAGAEQQTGETTEKPVDLSLYKKPAEVVTLDLSKEDPSNDEMRFVYDDAGRVSQCYYNIEDEEIYVNYKYEDGAVQIYAFIRAVVVADERIEISEYSADQGFTEINGYYFKGVTAK